MQGQSANRDGGPGGEAKGANRRLGGCRAGFDGGTITAGH